MVQHEREKFNNGKLDTILEALQYDGPRPRPHYLCHCPAHDDRNPSLSVTVTDAGKILLHCFAGCEIAAVLAALGLTWGDLMPQGQPPRQSPSKSTSKSKRPTPSATDPSATDPSATDPSATEQPSAPPPSSQPTRRPRLAPGAKRMTMWEIVATYEYCDVNGGHVCEVVRYEPKTFRQRRRVNGEWVWSLQGIKPPLYRLPELRAAPRHAWVYIVEGEKDVETLRQHGLVATCNIQGAGKWKSDYNQWLTNRLVCILPDNDEPGRAHAHAIAEQLQGSARQVQILELPNLPAKGDVSDWFAVGGNEETLEALLLQALYKSWLLTEDYVNINKNQPLPYPRDRKGKGRPHTTEYLAVLITKMGYEFALNELDDTIEVNGRQIDRTLEANIGCRMRDLGYKDMKALQEAYIAYAGTNRYHPVKRYLEGLNWDGQEHLARLASHLQDNHPPIIYDAHHGDWNGTIAHHGDVKVTVAKAWLLRFLVGAVARVYEHATLPAQPPMLVLDGRQGLGKSTLVRWLGSPLPAFL